MNKLFEHYKAEVIFVYDMCIQELRCCIKVYKLLVAQSVLKFSMDTVYRLVPGEALPWCP